MKLTKKCKLVIDTINSNPCNLQGRFYTIEYICSKIPNHSMSCEEVLVTLETAADERLVCFGDEQHSCIRILEKGIDYKEYRRLELAEQWKERIIGFILGVFLTVLAWVLSTFIKTP